MRIKKFVAQTEQGAIELVKEELGLEALVLNIKKIQPRGIFSLFKKPVVEVTAAYDETQEMLEPEPQQKEKVPLATRKSRTPVERPVERPVEKSVEKPVAPASEGKQFENAMKDIRLAEQQQKIKQLEATLGNTETMLQQLERQLSVANHQIPKGSRRYQNSVVQIFYDALIEQGVLEEIAAEILDEVDDYDEFSDIDENNQENTIIDVHFLVKVVYNAIVNMIGKPKTLDTTFAQKGEPRIVVFVGSTGVGKTTTIAKLSANFMLQDGLRVGLITADTYRIAAVEQLKTYADILGIELLVVYNTEDLPQHVNQMKGINDIIMVDTAGRSHKNEQNLHDLSELLMGLPTCETYLVLSLTTKYEDMLDIVSTYEKYADFQLIFTKLDETLRLGSVLNLCHQTGKKVSYITYGQNVPQDIRPLQPEEIAKALLGFCETV